MDDPKTVNQSPEAAALQGGEPVPSITPEGQAVNQSISETDRVTAVPKTSGSQGQPVRADAQDEEPSQMGDCGMVLPASTPDNQAHEGAIQY